MMPDLWWLPPVFSLYDKSYEPGSQTGMNNEQLEYQPRIAPSYIAVQPLALSGLIMHPTW